MWFYRIINSFLGIRKKDELKKDLNNISLFKVILLFLVINLSFISLILVITSFFNEQIR